MFVTVTLAPATTPPEESETVPSRVPVIACPNAAAGDQPSIISKVATAVTTLTLPIGTLLVRVPWQVRGHAVPAKVVVSSRVIPQLKRALVQKHSCQSTQTVAQPPKPDANRQVHGRKTSTGTSIRTSPAAPRANGPRSA